MPDWLSELKRLDAEATPGPWGLGAKVWKRQNGTELKEVIGPEHYIVTDWAPMPDAALIALLGSVRHELIAVVRAADGFSTLSGGTEFEAIEDARNELNAALAALREAMEK